MSSKNQKKVEEVAQWYQSTQGLNAYMIYCLFLELKEYIKEPLLEVGAADGYMTQLITENCSVKNYDIVEASEFYTATLSNEFPNINIINSFVENFASNKKYKTIIASHILEHVKDPKKFLDKLYILLDKSGKLLITVPNSTSMHRLLGVEMGLLKKSNQLNDQDKKIGHFRVYDKKLLRKHLEKSSFTIELISTSFLKFFSNQQTENFIPEQNWIYFYKLSKKFPENGADIFAVCKK